MTSVPPDDRQLVVQRFLDDVKQAMEGIDPLDLEAATFIVATRAPGGGLLVGHNLVGSNHGSSVGMVQVLLERLGAEHAGDGLDELRFHLLAMLAGMMKRYNEAYPPAPSIEIPRYEG